MRSKEKRYRLLMVVWNAGIVRKVTSTYSPTASRLDISLEIKSFRADTTNSSPPVPERSTSCACLINSTHSNIVLMSEGKTIDALEIRLKIRRQLKLNWRFAAIFPAPTRATKQGKSSGTCNRSSHSFLKVSLVGRDGTMGKMRPSYPSMVV